MACFVLAIYILLVGAIVSLFVKEKYRLKTCSIITLIASAVISALAIHVIANGETQEGFLNFSNLIGKVNFVMDPLGAFFTLIIAIMGAIGVIYANGYLKPYLNKQMNTPSHCFFLMILIAAMLAVVSTHNGLFFLIVWEIMSLVSFFLVIFENERKDALKAGIKYLIYMHISVIFLIAMFSILTKYSNSFDFLDYANTLVKHKELITPVFLLGFLGFGIKAGFVPFHNWLPDAHPAAPTHVSGIMSAVMIKTGIYGILRMLMFIGVPTKALSYTVLIVAVITALYGILYALTQQDCKKMLAYSSIENIGIIGMGIGIGMLGFTYNNPLMAVLGLAGALLHTLNHSIFKEILFFATGNIYLKTHTRNIESMGGIIKKMPITAGLYILGSIAICALPPFNGFISELFIYGAMLLGIPSSEINLFITLVIAIASLALVGTFAMLCFSRACGVMLLGEVRDEHSKNIQGEAEKIMLFALLILGVFVILIGTLPQYIITPIFTIVQQYIVQDNLMPIYHQVLTLTKTLSLLMCLLILIICIVFFARKALNRKKTYHNTWGCGYNKPNSHMQYTASSYSNLLVSTLKPLFKRVSHIKKPKALFPKEAYYEIEIEDIEEAYIVKPLLKWDEKILSKFERIQNGNIQQYILFGLIFLIIAVVGVILIG